jgi:hypothetical protein
MFEHKGIESVKIGSALPKDVKKNSINGSKVPPFAFKASDSAKASTGQDGGQAGFKACLSIIRQMAQSSKLKAQSNWLGSREGIKLGSKNWGHRSTQIFTD